MTRTTKFRQLATAKKAFEKTKRAFMAAPNGSPEIRETWREIENILQFVLDNFGDDCDAVEWVWFSSKAHSPLEDRAVEMLRHFK